MNFIERTRRVLVDRIIGLHDTPQRIAWGVFLGTIVAWTPTIGFQIVIYVAIATLLRANKVSGIPILFISNPVTAVPLYWFCWRVGVWILGTEDQMSNPSEFRERVLASSDKAGQTDLWTEIWTAEFWNDLGSLLLDMGSEMWVGSLAMGVVSAIPAYFLTLWSVRVYRRARGGP